MILELIVNVFKVQTPSINFPKAHECMAHIRFMNFIGFFFTISNKWGPWVTVKFHLQTQIPMKFNQKLFQG